MSRALNKNNCLSKSSVQVAPIATTSTHSCFAALIKLGKILKDNCNSKYEIIYKSDVISSSLISKITTHSPRDIANMDKIKLKKMGLTKETKFIRPENKKI